MTSIRIRGVDYNRLRKLRQSEEVREMARRQGLIGDNDDLTNEVVLKLALPDDAEPFERPEEEMVWTDAGEAKPEIKRLAGENVSIHEVVNETMESFLDEHDITITIQ
jgi:hypothetical protein